MDMDFHEFGAKCVFDFITLSAALKFDLAAVKFFGRLGRRAFRRELCIFFDHAYAGRGESMLQRKFVAARRDDAAITEIDVFSGKRARKSSLQPLAGKLNGR